MTEPAAPRTSVPVNMGMQPDGQQRARADTYGLLANLWSQAPTGELLRQLARLAEQSPSPGEGRMVSAWRTLGLAARHTDAAAADDEFHDLFIGIGRGELVPYGSWYLTGFLMDRPLVGLRRDLEQLGFERPAEVKEPEDHAAILCETMQLLVLNEPEISHAQQAAFFANHLAPWMPSFCSDLRSAKSACFYRAVGDFGERFLELETQYFDLA